MRDIDRIEEMRFERDSYIKKVQELDDEIKYKLLELRIEDTKEVLDYILEDSRKVVTMNNGELQKYIVHCLNKLNGNIDDVKISIHDNKELLEE